MLKRIMKSNEGSGVDTLLATTVAVTLIIYLTVYFVSLVGYFVETGELSMIDQQIVTLVAKNGVLTGGIDNLMRKRLTTYGNGGKFKVTYEILTYDAAADAAGGTAFPDKYTPVVSYTDQAQPSVLYSGTLRLQRGDFIRIYIEQTNSTTLENASKLFSSTAQQRPVVAKESIVERWTTQ